MKDFAGNELAEGDFVAFMAPKYRRLALGRVIKITPTKVRVFYRNTWNFPKPGRELDFLTSPADVVKIEGNRLLLKLLEE